MPVLRLCGGNVSMRCSPKRIRPASSSQKPATMRNSVVLPHPDGPSSVKNSPSRTAIDTSSTARTVPKTRAARSIVIAVKGPPGRWTSARIANDVLDLLRGIDAFLHPDVLVIIDELHIGKLRHGAGQFREIEVLARRTAESELQDRLAYILAR